MNDLVEALDPKDMTVTGDFGVRGGIKTIVTARHKK
jgi:NADPH-dependent 7-cyano-7-deazaguanine reductase QueF